MRYIGHLDLIHVFFRALKRAELPLTYTKGFNPRIKSSFSPALALGFESEAEYIELYLDKKIDMQSSMESLQRNLPEGLTVHSMIVVPLFAKSSNTKIKGVAYRVNLKPFYENSRDCGQVRRKDIEEGIRDFLDKEEIFLTDRKGRKLNVRPLIMGIEMEKEKGVRLLLRAREGFNLNPKAIIKAIIEVSDQELAFVEFTREKFLF